MSRPGDFYTPVDWSATTFENGRLLPLWAGFVIVLGFGAFFSLLTTVLSWLEVHYAGAQLTSEQFNTAGRTVKTGLTASVIVSQWTWAATLVGSSFFGWRYGISGPFWYAAGATIQVLLFGILAIELKIKAPTCHTFLEIVQARWGNTSHAVFLFYGFATCLIVSGMLLQGAVANITAITGLNPYAACFLVPATVVIYTSFGGLKATFNASYLHTAVIFIVLVIMVTTVYATSDKIGDAATLYDLLQTIAGYPAPNAAEIEQGFHCGPVSGNRGGSHVTMLSLDGFIFGIINIIGNFGTVFLDQSYWQSAIAAKPSASHKGYMLGGMVWFAIPFTLATSLGLAATALGAKLSVAEAASGLVPAAAATILLGVTGATLIVIMIFMAVVSTGSAECIAISSLVAYDVYRAYINPEATGQQILSVSRWTVPAYGAIMGGWAAILYYAEVPLAWTYQFMGTFIGAGVVPVALCLLWSKTNNMAATYSPLVGTALGLISWLTYTADKYDGEVTVNTTFDILANLVGNLVSILFPAVVTIIASLIWPENYDFVSMGQIPLVEEEEFKKAEDDETPEALQEARSWIMHWGLISSLALVVAWPVLTIPWGVFDKALFALWGSVAFVWGYVAAIVIIFYPIYESREGIYLIVASIFKGGAPKTTAVEGTSRA